MFLGPFGKKNIATEGVLLLCRFCVNLRCRAALDRLLMCCRGAFFVCFLLGRNCQLPLRQLYAHLLLGTKARHCVVVCIAINYSVKMPQQPSLDLQ